MRSILVLLILVMIGLNGKGQSVTALPDSVLSQCCLEVTLLNGNVTTVDWVFIQYITRDGTGTKLFVEYAPNFGGIQWETQIRVQDDFDEVIERSKYIMLPFTVATTDYAINRNWIANIESNITTGGTWVYGRFGTPAKRKFSAVEDYPTLKALLLACAPRAIVVAENGLYTEGDTVRMGGWLIEDTRITTDTFDWEMIDLQTKTAFGIDHNGVYGDTTFYAARRWGSWRSIFSVGRQYQYSQIIDTVGGERVQTFTGIDILGVPYLSITTHGNPIGEYAQFYHSKNFGYWLMKDLVGNPNYTQSISIFTNGVVIGSSEIGGPGEPGNGISIATYGSGTADEFVAITTRGVDNSTATIGQFLQLQNVLSGQVEYATAIVPSDTAAMLTNYIDGAGTINTIAKFTGTRTVGNSNLTDNNTRVAVENGKPFRLAKVATSGLPTGAKAYMLYDTTLNGIGWYNGNRWGYALESTFARGTAGYVPYFDLNGQVTANSGFTYNGVAAFVMGTLGNNLSLSFPNTVSGFGTSLTTIYASNQANLSLAGTNIRSTQNAITFVTSGSATSLDLQHANHYADFMGGRIYSSGHPTSRYRYGVYTTNPGAGFHIAGNILSNPSWTTLGIGLRIDGTTYTNTTSSGTVATQVVHGLSVSNFAASSSTTLTNASTFYVAGAPGAGTNTTITNPWAIHVGSGNSLFPSLTVTTTPAHASITGLLTRDANGWLGLTTLSGLSYSGGVLGISGTARTIPYHNNSSRYVNNVNFRLDTTTTAGALAKYYLKLNTGTSVLSGADSYNVFETWAGDAASTGGVFSVADQTVAYTAAGYEPRYMLFRYGASLTSASNLTAGNKIGRFSFGGWVGGAKNTNLGGIEGTYTGNGTSVRSSLLGISATTLGYRAGWLLDSLSRFWLGEGADDYYFPTVAPSVTLGVKQAVVWTGTGSAATPAFETITTSTSETKRDTTIYVVDADYNFSAAVTTAQINARYNRVIIHMTITSGPVDHSTLQLHTPDANLAQCEFLVRSNDANVSWRNDINFTTNGASNGSGGTLTTYNLAANEGLKIRAVNDGGWLYIFY